MPPVSWTVGATCQRELEMHKMGTREERLGPGPRGAVEQADQTIGETLTVEFVTE